MSAAPEIERIEGELARTRARIASHVDALERHLVPRQLLDDALATFSRRSGADVAGDLIARARANPLAAGLAGLGLAWLMTARPAAPPARSRPTIAVGPSKTSGTASAVDTPDMIAASDPFSTTGTPIMARTTNGTMTRVTGNPFALGAAAALVGIIAGALIPTLRKEEEALGSVATRLRVAGRDLAQDVVDRGGHVVEDTIGAAKGSADAHGLSAAKPIGEVFADAKSGALAQDVKQVAQDVLQAGRDSAQTHLSDAAAKSPGAGQADG